MSADQHKPLNEDSSASDESIQNVHDKLANEQQEPKEGFKTMPLFLLGFISTIIFAVCVYIVHYRGGFSPMVYDERFDPAKAAGAGAKELTPEQILASGKKFYQQQCATCHQNSGMGVPGTYPPLAASEWVTGNEERLIRVLLHGLTGPIEVKGNTYNGAMPAFGKVPGGGFNWPEERIAHVLTYIRHEWGNDAPAVTKEKVTEVLNAEKARTKPWTQGELDPFK